MGFYVLRPRSHYDNGNDRLYVINAITFTIASTCGHTQKMDLLLQLALHMCVSTSTASLFALNE